jgi:hypothetical protein
MKNLSLSHIIYEKKMKTACGLQTGCVHKKMPTGADENKSLLLFSTCL